MGAPAIVLTFEPHPRTVFRPEAPFFRLTTPDARNRIFAALGIDAVAVIGFDRAFSTTPAEDFISRILVERLAARRVVVGHDFHFGQGRGGSPAMLAEAGRRDGFAVEIVPPMAAADGEVYSSGRIRTALSEGDIATANRLLGYRWFVRGTVVHGDARGRELGYPTANIVLPTVTALRHGIYAVTLARPGGPPMAAVASYGRRPMFDNGEAILEVHVFDYTGNLYSQEVTVTFLAWIRPEERFDGIEALIARMDLDSAAARAAFAAAGPGTELDQALAGLLTGSLAASPAGPVAGPAPIA
jgi:riboflavin kinase/FMN adenylyltransferase